MTAELPSLDGLGDIAWSHDRRPVIEWEQIGVFPTQDCIEAACAEGLGHTAQRWNSFNYTVGLLPDLDLWMPCVSVEGKYMGNELTGYYLNVIAALWKLEALGPGMSFTFPIGVNGVESDMDAVGWIADEPVTYDVVEANMSGAERVYRILWSSPLGFDS